MFRAILGCLTTAAAITALAATPAAAIPAPQVSLALSVTYSSNDGAPSGTSIGSLTCAPNGGLHNDPNGACAELAAAGGDIEAADQEMTGFCPLHYAPVTVRAIGFNRGSHVDYTHTYGNSCFFAATASKIWDI